MIRAPLLLAAGLLASLARMATALPDLTAEVYGVELASGVSVSSGDVAEGCAASTDDRVLVRFGLRSHNLGPDPLVVGDPGCPDCATNPGAVCANPEFICSPAQGHNHPYFVERWNRDARILAFGVEVDGPFPTGLLLAACYYHTIGFAVRAGFPRLSLGTTRPVLTDGVLGYKRKWGAYVGRPTTWEAFLLRCRNTPAVRGALAAAPLIVDRGRRGLAAVIGLDEHEMGDDFLARVETPGVAGVVGFVARDQDRVPRGVRVVRPGDVWPPGAALRASAAPVPEPLPVRDLR